jgi:heme/copper-type cytochrome/quinol oxidase subunit 2
MLLGRHDTCAMARNGAAQAAIPGRSPQANVTSHRLETEMLDWIPIAFVTFKVLVFGTGMFFAIRWHYEQGKKGRPIEKRAVLRVAGNVALFVVVFGLVLTGVLLATFAVSNKLGLT